MNTPELLRDILKSARALVFDFDGTLVDSNEIKWRGFEHVFAGYGERIGEIRSYCRGSNHTIRGEKFRHVCEQILGIEYTAERAESFHADYGEFTTDAVATAPEVPGARQFLESVQSYLTCLLSSTPHEILIEILKRKDWRGLFDDIQGAPIVKREWLLGLQRRLECSGSEIVFFGDTREDAQSAQESGCTFVRIGRLCDEHAGLCIEDFRAISSGSGPAGQRSSP